MKDGAEGTGGDFSEDGSTNMEAKPREGWARSIGRNGYHRIAYRDWGDPTAPETVYCVHGFTRNSHDFDPLARALATSRRVVCPDLVGRGRSDWLSDPADYHLLQYNLDFTVLEARIGAEKFDWIGTSLGGLMGISLAGLPNSPIQRLVIDDFLPVCIELGLHAHPLVFRGFELGQSDFLVLSGVFELRAESASAHGVGAHPTADEETAR